MVVMMVVMVMVNSQSRMIMMRKSCMRNLSPCRREGGDNNDDNDDDDDDDEVLQEKFVALQVTLMTIMMTKMIMMTMMMMTKSCRRNLSLCRREGATLKVKEETVTEGEFKGDDCDDDDDSEMKIIMIKNMTICCIRWVSHRINPRHSSSCSRSFPLEESSCASVGVFVYNGQPPVKAISL